MVIILFCSFVISIVTGQRLSFLSHIGGTPTLMLGPPKEHLIEQVSVNCGRAN